MIFAELRSHLFSFLQKSIPIDALEEQIKSGRPTFDLRPLIELIKQSTSTDVRAALAKDMTHKSTLRDALVAFRKAVRPPKKTVGMHYKHYTTLRQGLDLLYHEWAALSDDYDFDKCDLVGRQIIGHWFGHARKNIVSSGAQHQKDVKLVSGEHAVSASLGFKIFD